MSKKIREVPNLSSQPMLTLPLGTVQNECRGGGTLVNESTQEYLYTLYLEFFYLSGFLRPLKSTYSQGCRTNHSDKVPINIEEAQVL